MNCLFIQFPEFVCLLPESFSAIQCLLVPFSMFEYKKFFELMSAKFIIEKKKRIFQYLINIFFL